MLLAACSACRSAILTTVSLARSRQTLFTGKHLERHQQIRADDPAVRRVEGLGRHSKQHSASTLSHHKLPGVIGLIRLMEKEGEAVHEQLVDCKRRCIAAQKSRALNLVRAKSALNDGRLRHLLIRANPPECCQ